MTKRRFFSKKCEKSRLSRSVKFVREGVKLLCKYGAAKTCGKKCFPIFGIPRGLTTGVGPGEGTKNLIYPAKSIDLSSPQTIEKKIYWKFESILKELPIQEDGILTLDNGLATSKGGNLSSNGSLVTTFLQPIDGKPPHKNDLFHFSTKKFFPRIFYTDAPVITLTAGWQGAFYHWVHEVLPRLHLIDKAEHSKEKIYVEVKFSFQKESLDLLGIAPQLLIKAHEYAAVSTPKLIIPSIPQIPTEWTCQFLREKILPRLCPPPSLRLYISRNDATKRRILNEPEVVELLKKYSFERVELSGKSFKEQAELFHAAEAIVGPHGAGFSHLVFCKPKTPILEIFSPAYFHPCYWCIANRVGLPYYYLFGEGERYPDFFDPHQDPDILVDLGKLEDSLRLMGL